MVYEILNEWVIITLLMYLLMFVCELNESLEIYHIT